MPKKKATKPIVTSSGEESDIVWKSESSRVSKAQQEFNDALNRHRETKNRADEVQSLISLLNQKYVEDIIPELDKQKSLTKKRFVMMCEILLKEKISLGKTQREFLRRHLIETCEESLLEDQTFYLRYLEILETKSERMKRLDQKKRMEASIKMKFGVDIDLDDLNRNDFENEEEKQSHEEKYRDFREKFEEYRNQFYEEAFERESKSQKKKSKTQVNKEAKLLDMEKLLSLDINALFKNLAKLIHPDKEQDPILRNKKSVLMTKLSGARDNMNIAEILEIKMQVDELLPHQQTDVSFNESSIRRFVSILKTKIRELEQSINNRLFSHPLMEDFPGKTVNVQNLKKYLDKIVKDNQMLSKAFATEVDHLERDPKYLREIIRDLQSF